MFRAAVLVVALAPSDVRAAEPPAVSFRTDVVAALSRVGCNSGACHGSPQGKNGFRLSLRGQDPDLDFATLTKELGGRRVNRQSPDDSLVLMKASGRVSHGGGQLFGRDHAAYRAVARWIAEGARDDKPPPLVKLEVTPGAKRLDPASPSQQLAVQAHFADGTVRDVTALTVFTTGESAAKVTPGGLVTFARTGEASVLARYLTGITSVRLSFVMPDPAFAFRAPAANNFIDTAMFAKQKEMQLLPAAVCSDEVFLRRVYLDAIGTLPTPEEAAAFLDSKEKDKRAKLIDALLDREEFAYFWALKWADVLRGSPTTISERGVHSFHRYLVRSVADDKPVTQLARELLTGSGNTLHKPAANFYRVARTPEEAAEAAAQLFLGVRVQCARCHSHPFENITQADYYGLAAFFARVQLKGAQFGLDDEVVYTQPGRELNNPITRKPQPPAAFGWVAPATGPDDDRRDALADWLTDPKNKFFAPSVANRVWFHLLGRGIVDPVDDFRDTNPPSNPDLLTALADHFARGGYKLKPLVRVILNSNTYQLASEAPKQSALAADPDRYFVKASVRMLTAEQILDAVSSATGVPEKFKGYPAGTRAIALPEGGLNHPFLTAFAKPVRDVVCECAREEDPALPQVLHMLNNAGVLAKVKSSDGRVAGWLKAGKDDAWIEEHLYLATLSRRPTERERELVTKHLARAKDRAAGLQDVQHALLNLNEFLLRH
jgi:transglutaminase-like putative cysteine protease